LEDQSREKTDNKKKEREEKRGKKVRGTGTKASSK
jgi:hypothetical protein